MAEEIIKAPGESATPITQPGPGLPVPIGIDTTLPYSLPANAEPELVHAVVAAAHRVAPIEGTVVQNLTKVEPLDPERAANPSTSGSALVEPEPK